MRSLIISLVVVYLAVVCHGTRPLNLRFVIVLLLAHVANGWLRVNAPVDDSFISKITLLDQVYSECTTCLCSSLCERRIP